MFLELLAEYNLLQHSPETNILRPLALEPKAGVLTTLFQELIDNKENTKTMISSKSHLNFFYELLGAAFSLPLSHSALTLKAFEIYKSWINEPEICPDPVNDNPNAFYIVIFKQMSQFFQNSPSQEIDQEDMRNMLCGSIMKLMRDVYMKHYESLTDEVFDIIVRVMIGVVKSYFLHFTNPEVQKNISIEFKSEIEMALYILHEAWMLSEVIDMDLWEVIWRDYSQWTNSLETIAQWYALQQSLTDATLKNIGKNDEKIEFELKWAPWNAIIAMEPFKMIVSAKYVNYAFVRFSRFVGNCITKTKEISYHATYATKLLIESFYDYPKEVCDGNVVLKMFGQFLFQNMIINREGYDDTVTMATETILTLFVHFAERTTFKKEYIADLYAGIISILNSPNPVSITVLAYPLILDLPLEGIEILYPSYIRYVYEILFKCNPTPVIRGQCYQVLAKIIPKLTFFAKRPLPVIAKPIYETYSEMISAIDSILAKQLKEETEILLIVDLMEISRIFLCETKSLPITQALVLILERQFVRWINIKSLTLAPAIGKAFGKLYQTAALTNSKNTQYLNTLVDSLMKSYSVFILDRSFNIHKEGSFVVDMNNLLRYIFGLIGSVPFVSFGNYSKIVDKLNMFSGEADDDVCNSIQLFSDNISISKINTQLYSHSPIQEIMLQESNPDITQFHSFIISSDKSLVTIIDFPSFQNQNVPILMIIRTPYSQTVCAVSLVPPTLFDVNSQQAPGSKKPISYSETTGDYYRFIGTEKIGKLLDPSHIEKTKSIIQGLNKAEHYFEPINPNEELVSIQINETSFQKPLSFYSSMKLCSALNIFPNPTTLKQVQINEQVISEILPSIDQIATRPQYVVSLFNIKDQSVIENSKESEWFIQRLGWLVDVKQGSFYLFPQSILELQNNLTELPMVCSPTEQIIYCPNSRVKDDETLEKIRQLSDVIILWGNAGENTQQWAMETIVQDKQFIVIEPLPDGRFAVFNEEILGNDYVVVSAEGLVPFVNISIRSIVQRSKTTIENSKKRHKLIRDIYENVALPIPPVDFVFDRLEEIQQNIQYVPSTFAVQNTRKSKSVMNCLNRYQEDMVKVQAPVQVPNSNPQ